MNNNANIAGVVPPSFLYDQIDGWFDFASVYDLIIEEMRKNSKNSIVEVGSWLGKSTVYLANRLKCLSAPRNYFYAVDTWQGSPDESVHERLIAQLKSQNKTLFEAFIENLIKADCFHLVYPIISYSILASNYFKTNSLLAVFLDADHCYASVSADLRAWYPKVIRGGIFAGHDIFWGEVHLAVEQFCDEFELTFKIDHKSWVIRKP